jgi:hypothetical protein
LRAAVVDYLGGNRDWVRNEKSRKNLKVLAAFDCADSQVFTGESCTIHEGAKMNNSSTQQNEVLKLLESLQARRMWICTTRSAHYESGPWALMHQQKYTGGNRHHRRDA